MPRAKGYRRDGRAAKPVSKRRYSSSLKPSSEAWRIWLWSPRRCLMRSFTPGLSHCVPGRFFMASGGGPACSRTRFNSRSFMSRPRLIRAVPIYFRVPGCAKRAKAASPGWRATPNNSNSSTVKLFVFSQFEVRPLRYLLSARFETIPSSSTSSTRQKSDCASPGRASLNRIRLCGLMILLRISRRALQPTSRRSWPFRCRMSNAHRYMP